MNQFDGDPMNRFAVEAVVVHSGDLKQKWEPVIGGYVEPGTSIELTWVPPAAGRFDHLRIIQAPGDAIVYSLNVAGEECVDPRAPYPWHIFHTTFARTPLVLGIPYVFGNIFSVRIGRP